MNEKYYKRFLKISGVILRKTNFRESSIIFELLSPAYGKMSFIAKGVRKSKSKLLGIFEPLNIINIEAISSANSELLVVKSADFVDSKLPKNNYENYIAVSVAVEFLLNIHLDEHEYEPFYHLLISFLDYLPKVRSNQIVILWRFILRAYKLLGIDFNLKDCAICEKPLEEYQKFSQHNHGFICSECSEKDNSQRLISIPHSLNIILQNLYHIGNQLDSIKIDDQAKKVFNAILIDFFDNQFNTNLQLKSLSFL